MPPPRVPIKDRFWKRVNMQPFGCWETDYTPSQRYAMVKVEGRWVKAHRVAYELTIGPIPAGMVVMHECDNPRCVRPCHLDVGTVKDNAQDMSRKKRGRGQRDTRCKRGHSRWGKRNGRRYCMDCELSNYHSRKHERIAELDNG